MTNYPPEYVTDEGEVLEGSGALATARRELASFKFRLFRTMNADPKVEKSLLAASMVLADFVTIDKRTLKPTVGYLPTLTVMARANLARSTIKLVRKQGKALGYWEPQEKKTKAGCLQYLLANPHEERIRMNVKDKEEYLRGEDAYRKELERLNRRGPTIAPPESDVGADDRPDKGPINDPNYHGTYHGKFSSEGKANTVGANDSQPDQPFPIPSDPEAFIVGLFDGREERSGVLGYFRAKLLRGELRLSDVDQHLALMSMPEPELKTA
ncbi:MAG TPA: hypothetical protein VGX71_16470 [Pseudaminobacter sp.]|nr:hypothetical protein [Pseudaminobacter sp.]